MSESIVVKTDPRQELRELVAGQLKLFLEQNNLEGIKTLLQPVHPADIAEAIERLPEGLQLIAFRLLSKDVAISVYEHLEPSCQQSLIEQFKRQEVIDIVGQMSPDDRARLFDELPASVVSRILEQLSPEERQATNLLLGYEEGTAGRIMTPEYVAVKQNLTVEDTIERLHTLAGRTELVYYIYVTDDSRHLMGVVSLRDLVIHQPEETLEQIMTRDVIYVKTDTSQEEVAHLIQRYDLLAIPVVDRELRLVGIVTVDDVIDILEQEATEEIYALGAVPAGDGYNYFRQGLFTIARRRLTWLLVLLFTNTLTGSIIGSQEAVISKVTVLAAFIPLLIGTGGNIGTQSSTVVIRGLTTGQLEKLGAVRVILREGVAGVLLGIMLAVLTSIWAYFLPHTRRNPIVAAAVGLSLLAISVISTVAGSFLPFFFRRLGLDPALMSAPFITTIVDVLGVLIYFYIARFLLGI